MNLDAENAKPFFDLATGVVFEVRTAGGPPLRLNPSGD
ncbi:hypothetical protein I553_1603 [Mycobacterium xenopi 4042]|uniref:Uncharacterized protein n=1 Tax=Mycobacterium xenopi 4042 TaxID=1299334 RepID=X8CFQ9_MYCXE|nr:hypothetical protein I553_1603 [Mycobacterium xenopi 4042]